MTQANGSRRPELQAGHRLLNAGKGTDSESWSEVISVKIAKENLRAYNLHVDKFHSFYVRGADNDNAPAVWVHNAKDCEGYTFGQLRKAVEEAYEEFGVKSFPKGNPGKWGSP